MLSEATTRTKVSTHPVSSTLTQDASAAGPAAKSTKTGDGPLAASTGVINTTPARSRGTAKAIVSFVFIYVLPCLIVSRVHALGLVHLIEEALDVLELR